MSSPPAPLSQSCTEAFSAALRQITSACIHPMTRPVIQEQCCGRRGPGSGDRTLMSHLWFSVSTSLPSFITAARTLNSGIAADWNLAGRAPEPNTKTVTHQAALGQHWLHCTDISKYIFSDRHLNACCTQACSPRSDTRQMK